MIRIRSIQGLSDNNSIMGDFPTMIGSAVNFNGENNILYCEPGVTLSGSVINFFGDNSVIYLSSNRNEYIMDVTVYNDSVFFMGQHNYINSKMIAIISEQRHFFMGDYGMIASGVMIRDSDPHLIYDCNTRKRINSSKSVYVGDHVWIGQNCLILKGTQIDSGSIIGGMTVLPQKKIPHNTTWAGNPAKQIKKDVFWDRAFVHAWKEDMTRISESYDDFIRERHPHYCSDGWIFEYSSEESIEYEDIDNKLNSLKNSHGKLEYLIHLRDTKTKNRFVHKI